MLSAAFHTSVPVFPSPKLFDPYLSLMAGRQPCPSVSHFALPQTPSSSGFPLPFSIGEFEGKLIFHVLVVAGVELNIFIPVITGLCFEFVPERLLITEVFLLLLSNVYKASKPFLLPSPLQWGGWGCTGIWEMTQVGKLTQIHLRDTPYNTQRIKLRGDWETGGRRCSGRGWASVDGIIA